MFNQSPLVQPSLLKILDNECMNSLVMHSVSTTYIYKPTATFQMDGIGLG